MLKPTILLFGVDILLFNIVLMAFALPGWDNVTCMEWLLLNAYYIVSALLLPTTAQKRFVRVDKLLGETIKNVGLIYVLRGLYAMTDGWASCTLPMMIGEAAAMIVVMFYGRYFVKQFMRRIRNLGRNNKKVVFVGAGVNLTCLYEEMKYEYGSGYNVLGYFEDKPSKHLPEELERLGRIEDVTGWLERNYVDQVYCNLPPSRQEEIVKIINYSERHFIRFFSVPNVRNYVHRALVPKMVNSMPVLTLRQEPLGRGWNRAVKRMFDIVFAGVFVVTCFWWIALIVAAITKITMPGPVFFKQKRNGLRGKEFYCLKFRSMRVNKDADTVQATADDPRKTKWGDIMRRTNIDELPQFLNVLEGSMSVVGPRPHMVKHTEQYSALIDKYMVRHWVKPGITGWAQVKGSRGETKELWQMEERVKKDVWYVENWSLLLDILIIYLTIRNMIRGDGQAY